MSPKEQAQPQQVAAEGQETNLLEQAINSPNPNGPTPRIC